MSEELARARVVRDVLAHRLREDRRVQGVSLRVETKYYLVLNVEDLTDVPETLQDSFGGFPVEVHERSELTESKPSASL